MDGYGWLLNDITGYGWLLSVVNGYGWLLSVITGYGWLLSVVNGYGWLLSVITGYGQLLSVINGYGWLSSISNGLHESELCWVTGKKVAFTLDVLSNVYTFNHHDLFFISDSIRRMDNNESRKYNNHA